MAELSIKRVAWGTYWVLETVDMSQAGHGRGGFLSCFDGAMVDVERRFVFL